MTNQKNTWSIVLAIVIAAIIVGGGVYFWQTQDSTRATETPDKSDTVVPLDPMSEEVVVSETAEEETEDGTDVSTWNTYENEEYGYTIRYPDAYQPSGTAGSYLLKKEITDSIRILSLTSGNHKQLEQFEFSGETGWYDWALAGFPEDDSVAGRMSYNKRVVTLGDNVFTVVNYDGASSWGGAPFYYLVTESTVFLLIGNQGIDSRVSNPLHEKIIGTFSLSTSHPFGK